MLNELDIFKKIEVFFLIVGHTHCSIDQYFSIISRDIYQTDFIGSPLALAALIAREKTGKTVMGKNITKEKPLLVRKISVVYDMKAALDPLINKKIKYYMVPHVFVFEKWCGISTMQYSIFSSSSTLLPLRPNNVKGRLSESLLRESFKLKSVFSNCRLYL